MGFLKVLLWAKARDKSKYNNSFRNQIMYIVADDKQTYIIKAKKLHLNQGFLKDFMMTGNAVQLVECSPRL